MNFKKTTIVVSGLVLVIALIVGISCGVILSSPVELTSTTGGNYVCNMMNDGFLLTDSGYIFYANPKTGILYRAEIGDSTVKPIKIADNCKGYIQVVQNSYFFLRGPDFVSCNFKGENITPIVKNVSSPLTVGGTIYYKNDKGNICKYSIRYKTTTDLKIKPKDKFTVYYNKLYYTTTDGIYTAKTDGSEQEMFSDKPADKFCIDGEYLFYTDKDAVYSARSSENGFVSAKITDATDFGIILSESKMIYSDKNGVMLSDMNKLTNEDGYKPTSLSKTYTQYIYNDDSYFFWFDENNNLNRSGADGTGKVLYKAP